MSYILSVTFGSLLSTIVHLLLQMNGRKHMRSALLYPRREAGILWIHHRRPQRFLVSDLQSTFLSRFLSYLAGGLIWWRTRHPIFLVGFMSQLGLW